MKKWLTVLMTVFLGMAMVTFTGCRESDDLGDELEDVGDEIGDAAEDAADEVN